MMYPEHYIWRPGSGLPGGRWRLWKEANPAGSQEYQTLSGRTWYCFSFEAARRKADEVNALEAAKALELCKQRQAFDPLAGKPAS
jgi:hypothetical protein